MRLVPFFSIIALFLVWPGQARGDENPFNPDELKLERTYWILPLGDLAQGASTKMGRVDGQDLFLLDTDNTLHCIDLKRGNHRWILELPGEPTDSRPGIGADAVGVCVRDRLILVKRSNGARIMDKTIGFSPCTPPACSRDVVYVGTFDKESLVSVDTSDGIQGWRFRFGDVTTTTPKLYGEGAELFLYAAAEDGLLVCLPPNKASEGAPRRPSWRYKMAGRNTADLVVDSDLLLVASGDSALYAFNRLSGVIKWKFFAGVPLKDEPQLIGDCVFQKVEETIHCLDRATGAEKWEIEGCEKVAGLVDDRVYFWTNDGRFALVNVVTGKLISKVEPAGIGSAIPNSEPGMILFTDGKKIYAYK